MTVYVILGDPAEPPQLVESLRAHGHSVEILLPSSLIVSDLNADVLIEAMPEDYDVRVAALRAASDSGLPVITTSGIYTVSDLAEASGLGSRLSGFHHLAAYGSQLAELVTEGRSARAADAARALATDLGIDAIEVPDVPGRLSRRLLTPFIDGALRAEDLGIATADGIDDIVRLGLGHERGPLVRVREAGLEEHSAVSAALREDI